MGRVFRFHLRRRGVGMDISASEIVGMVRGMEKARNVSFLGYIEDSVTKEEIVVTIEIKCTEYQAKMIKGQAESYMVVVEQFDSVAKWEKWKMKKMLEEG